MSFELRKSFLFDAAHTLRRTVDVEPSLRVHGHSYRGELILAGGIDPASGMLVDLGYVDRVLRELHQMLDHRFLDEVEGLGPATMENLCLFIWRHAQPRLPQLRSVGVWRDATREGCIYRPD